VSPATLATVPPYATAADLAHTYNVAPATIRSWAYRDGWRRTRRRPIRYSCADAQASYDRRHAHQQDQLRTP